MFVTMNEEVTKEMICLGEGRVIRRLLPMNEACGFWGYHDDIK